MATPAKAGRRETRGRLAFDMCFISNYLAKWSFSGPTDVKYFALRACMGWWVPGILNKSPKIGDRTCGAFARACQCWGDSGINRKSTRLNSSHLVISYAVFCLK